MKIVDGGIQYAMSRDRSTTVYSPVELLVSVSSFFYAPRHPHAHMLHPRRSFASWTSSSCTINASLLVAAGPAAPSLAMTGFRFSNLTDTLRGQPNSHKVKREYVFSDHHSDILGTGGYSRVERVKSLKRGEVVAMKIVPKQVISNKQAYMTLLARLREMYQELDNDNIIRCYEWFESLDRYYIAFELAAGGDLFDRISNGGRFSERDSKGVMRRVLDALDWVQNFGLIHRDIKPENFFYRDSTDPLNFGMADFGLALVLENRGPEDNERFYEIAGTPGYAAPEIYRKTGYGKKSDMFGCGVLAYIILSSWSPWNSVDPKQLMVETMTAPVKFYTSHWQGVSTGAKDFVTRLTEKDPDKRPSPRQALLHPWLTSSEGEDNEPPMEPIKPRISRAPTAKAETYYDGCQLAKELTNHADTKTVEPIAA